MPAERKAVRITRHLLAGACLLLLGPCLFVLWATGQADIGPAERRTPIALLSLLLLWLLITAVGSMARARWLRALAIICNVVALGAGGSFYASRLWRHGWSLEDGTLCMSLSGIAIWLLTSEWLRARGR